MLLRTLGLPTSFSSTVRKLLTRRAFKSSFLTGLKYRSASVEVLMR